MKRDARIRFGKLAEIGCVLCHHLGTPGTSAEIHHLRSGQGMGQRAPSDLTIPLCHIHHRSDRGFHGMGKRAFEEAYGVSEIDLLVMANDLIGVMP